MQLTITRMKLFGASLYELAFNNEVVGIWNIDRLTKYELRNLKHAIDEALDIDSDEPQYFNLSKEGN